MRRLNRAAFAPPADWIAKVEGALPDWKEFQIVTMQFELLAPAHEDRRSGFKKYKHAAKVLVAKKGIPDFPSIWGHCKDALADMSEGKCSYCEYPINASRSGQVDHFRPKTYFPSLAYEWTNYFLACGGCNGAKSDKWNDYIRPDLDDVENLLMFAEDGKLTSADKKALATIADFEMNRKWLVRIRRRAVNEALSRFDQIVEEYKRDPGVGERLARSEWARIADPGTPFSVAISQVVARRWQADLPGVPLP